jgi:hypothetical protein
MFWMLYSFFCVISHSLNFKCRHFRLLSLFHLHRRCKQVLPAYTAYEDGTDRQCSETLAYKIQTPGNHPKERIQDVICLHFRHRKTTNKFILWYWNISDRSHTNMRLFCRGTQNKSMWQKEYATSVQVIFLCNLNNTWPKYMLLLLWLFWWDTQTNYNHKNMKYPLQLPFCQEKKLQRMTTINLYLLLSLMTIINQSLFLDIWQLVKWLWTYHFQKIFIMLSYPCATLMKRSYIQQNLAKPILKITIDIAQSH